VSAGAARLQQARVVADAVLYEGYLLYPYRASSEKNRNRWQFGVLGPEGAADRGLGEAPSMTMQTILTGLGDRSTAVVHLRFLQLQHRQVLDAEGHEVDTLEVGGRTELTWDEAVEQELTVAVELAGLAGAGGPVRCERSVGVEGGEETEELRGPDGAPAASVVRRRWPLLAQVSVHAEPHGAFTVLTVSVHNDHPDRPATKEQATRCSLLGAHLLVEADACTFVSLVDPPAAARPLADRCHQDRCWPFLCGQAAGPDRDEDTDIVLGSPIILYDHPALAPESAGALFDATEIDEILTLRVMTMTDAEKAEARATDPRAAAIIDRCDAMSPGDLQQLHGIFRDPHGPLGDGYVDPGSLRAGGETPWWDPENDASVDPGTDAVVVDGTVVSKGSLVRVHPSRRADAQDLFFAGQVARVTAVLSDVDGGTHVALVLVDDPAADLHDWYGRYFYFAPEELEPLDVARKENKS
jgi:hypothetical protein